MLRNTAIVGGAFVASRLLGLVRENLIAREFGAGPTLDAYVAAFRIPDLLFLVIMAGSFGAAFIPVFSGFLARDRDDLAWELASAVLTVAAIATVVLAGITFLLADVLSEQLLMRGADPATQELCADLMRILVLSPILLGLGIAAKGILEAQDHFLLPALAPLVYNVAIVFAAAFLTGEYGIMGLAYGVIAGAFVHAAIQIPGLIRSGMRYIPTFSLDTPGLARVGRLLLPRVIGQAAFQINFIVVTFFATSEGAGVASAFNFAWQLLMLPHGVIALSISTVVFPSLARLYEQGDGIGFRRTFSRALRPLVYLSLPSAVILFAFRTSIIQVLLENGAFDANDVRVTANALAFFAAGLIAYAVVEVLTRVFYGMNDTRTPVVAGVATIGLNVVLCALLVDRYQAAGLALSLSLTTAIEGVILLVVLVTRLGGFVTDFGDWLFRTALATAAMGMVCAVLAEPLADVTAGTTAPFLAQLAMLGLALSLAGGTYLGVSLFTNLDEPVELADRFAPRLETVVSRGFARFRRR